MAESIPETAEVMWQGRYITAIREGRWEYVNRARGLRAAVILAIDDAADGQHVILIEEYRTALHRRCLALPAGLIGDEADAGEAVLTAAQRELAEEAGYRAARWQDVGDYCSSPGMVGETFTLMIARGLERVGDGGGVAGEDISVHRVAMADVAAFVTERRAAGVAIDVRLTMLLAPLWLGSAWLGSPWLAPSSDTAP